MVLGANLLAEHVGSAGRRAAAGQQHAQTAFFTDLFGRLGIAKPADVDSEDVWVRRFLTKNGLQQWVMAYNSGRAAMAGLTLSFPLKHRPRRLLDVVSGKAGGVHLGTAARYASANLDIDANSDADLRRRFGRRALPRSSIGSARSGVSSRERRSARPRAVAQPAGHGDRDGRFSLPPAPIHRGTRPPRSRVGSAESTAGPAWQMSVMASGMKWDWRPTASDCIGGRFACPRPGKAAASCWPSCPSIIRCFWNVPSVRQRPGGGEYRGHGWSNFDVLDMTEHLHPGENALAVAVEAHEVRGGYIGQLVAYPLENLEEPIELQQGWKLYSDNRQFAPAAFPLKAPGRHLETDVHLPAAWKGKQVFLEFEVDDRWVGCVVVNGRVIGYNQSFHPYPNIMQINLYPWAKAGRSNRIELWPRTPEETAAGEDDRQERADRNRGRILDFEF